MDGVAGPGVTVSVCPAAVVGAPINRVWALVSSPEGLDAWVDATLLSADPDGPARPGQRLRLETGALGRRFPVTIDVLEVDEEAHRLRLLVALPLGVVNDENVTLSPAGGGGTLVRLG